MDSIFYFSNQILEKEKCIFHFHENNEWSNNLLKELVNHSPVKPWINLIHENIPELTQFSWQKKHCLRRKVSVNWKILSEIYLENLHVPFMHPSLDCMVDATSMQSSQFENGSIQWIKKNIQPTYLSLSPSYQNLKIFQKNTFNYEAVWIYVYPNIMIEWMEHGLIIAKNTPLTPELTEQEFHFFYPNELLSVPGFSSFIQNHQNSFIETLTEDDEIASRIHQGRHYLWQNKIKQEGPYHPVMEKTQELFVSWYLEQINK